MNEGDASRTTALVILGQGNLYNSAAEDEVACLAARLRDVTGYRIVVPAFVEHGTPGLPEALEQCRSQGMERAVVVPAFMPLEPGMQSWVKKIARRWQSRSATRMEVVVAGPFTSLQNFPNTLHELARVAEESNSWLPARNSAEGTNPEWSVIPRHGNHVMFCTGPRCTALGSGDLFYYLRESVAARGLETGPNSVLVARTGCLYPCNLGPLMVAYPEGVWYCGLDRKAIDQILEQHFEGGRIASEFAHVPADGRQRISRKIGEIG